VSAPVPSGRQNRPQHCSETAQTAPAAAQAGGTAPRQRIMPVRSGRHAPGPPSQQSISFMHRSPSAPQWPGPGAHRPIPSGPAMQWPEQQPASPAHSSPAGRQPTGSAQRETPSLPAMQRPPQQSLPSMQISKATLQPGSALQLPVAPGMASHWPLQQPAPVRQLSPATRQNASNWQCSMPVSCVSPQSWPQQSAGPAHGSPAARQPGGSAAQCPPMHAPSQQSCAT
jgi:hypothetical protein